MQIKIEAQDMLYVLVEAGIDATDAKAIIFDLLQLPETGPERKALLEARRERLKAKAAKADKKSKVEDEYVLEDDGDGEADEDEVDEAKPKLNGEKKSAVNVKDPLKPTKVKKPKRVNFSSFGGTAPPLR